VTTLADLQAIAARGQYLLRVTLDYLYPPYSNWSTCAGQSAYELDQVNSYLQLWPRCQLWVEQPVGFFIPCDRCDLVTLEYLFFQKWGACRPPAIPGQPCTLVISDPICGDAPEPVTPTFGPNLSHEGFITESGNNVIVADTEAPLPCRRDWVALGLGTPPPLLGPQPPRGRWVPNSWQGAPG
jgi:hypothetical protein